MIHRLWEEFYKFHINILAQHTDFDNKLAPDSKVLKIFKKNIVRLCLWWSRHRICWDNIDKGILIDVIIAYNFMA